MRYFVLLLVGVAAVSTVAAQPCHEAAERAPESVATKEPAAQGEAPRALSGVQPAATPTTAHRCNAIVEACCTCCAAGSTPFAPATPRVAALATALLAPVAALTAPPATHRPADAPVRGPPAPEASSGHGPRGPPPTA